jgi:hypothetical protein
MASWDGNQAATGEAGGRLTMAEIDRLPVGTPIRVKWAGHPPWFDYTIGRHDGVTCAINHLGNGTELQEKDFVLAGGGDLRRLAEPMHAGCCACRAKTTCRDPEEATVVLLVASLLEDGLTVEDWYEMLCFYHRRRVDDAVKSAVV